MERHYLVSSLEFRKKLKNVSDSEYRRLIEAYDDFLEQPLKLEMFFPCDDDGNVLKEPKKTNYQVDVNTKCSGWKYLYDSNDKLIGYYDDRKWKEDFVKYKQAKEKVLFEGFYWKVNYAVCMAEDEMIYINYEFMHNMTIDKFLTTIITDLQLTENAIKQIGL